MMTDAHVAYLGLGTNMGDRQANLAQALQTIRAKATVEQISDCYETKPVGYLAQPDFLNLVCRITTDLAPDELLNFLKQIEQRLGRQPSFRDAPRPIDIDILFYDDVIRHTDGLDIPHPRLHERSFVLVPLAEIAPDLIHPELGQSVADLSARINQRGIIRQLQGLTFNPHEDVQTTQPATSTSLRRVGITGLRRIIRFTQRGQENLFYAELDLYADLNHSQMGVHMSRFSDILEEIADEILLEKSPNIETLTERVARQVVQKQRASRAEVQVRAVYPMEKTAPLSGRKTQELYTLLGIAVSTPDWCHHIVGVEAEGMTVCPCAQGMVRDYARERMLESGAAADDVDRMLSIMPIASHNQRGRGTLMIGSDELIHAEDLVEIVEASMSSETYGLLKRQDELFVVNKAHHNPRFVEDVVREMLRNVLDRFAGLPDGAFVLAKQVNFEGIHKHNAFAEHNGTLGEIRGEILQGIRPAHHTSTQEWLEMYP